MLSEWKLQSPFFPFLVAKNINTGRCRSCVLFSLFLTTSVHASEDSLLQLPTPSRPLLQCIFSESVRMSVPSGSAFRTILSQGKGLLVSRWTCQHAQATSSWTRSMMPIRSSQWYSTHGIFSLQQGRL